MTTILLRFKSALFVAVLFLATITVQATTLFENFDNPSAASTTNNGATITYPSGSWFTNGITKPNTATENDRINGVYSIRMRGLAGKNLMYMNFDKAGAGVLSFNYGSYSNHSGGKFKIQKSLNSGTLWTDISNELEVPEWSGTFLTFSVIVNESANVRFRISITETTNANTQVNIDDFMITDFGTEQVTLPTSNVPTGIYQTPQTVSLSSATVGATIYYTTDGTAPTTASTVYSTPLNITTTTKIRMFAVSSGKVDSREEVVLISLPESVATLADFYTKMATTGTNRTYFKYTGEAIVTASYTATYKTLFLQDNTAGILISDTYRNTTLSNSIGDKITGIIAQVNRANDSPQLYPYNDFTILSSGNSIIAPEITLADVPNHPNQLVQINNLFFDEANGTKAFGPNTPYVIHDGSMATTTTTFRTPSGMPDPDYRNAIIPANRNIIGIIYKSAATVFSIFARNAAELDVQLTGINQIKTINLSVSGNFVQFETVAPETVKVFSIDGRLLKNQLSIVGINNIDLSKGVYILRIGNKTAKVLL